MVLVEAQRTVKGSTSIERRFYIASSQALSAASALHASRAHWGIENELHRVLDVAYREDDSRVREGHAAENFAVMRHLSLNLLKAVKGSKVGIKTKRLRAGWDHDFLARVLAAGPVGG